MIGNRFSVVRIKNPVSKKTGNYIQDNGSTILKLSSLEDCKNVCDVLNEQEDMLRRYMKSTSNYHTLFSEKIDELRILKKDLDHEITKNRVLLEQNEKLEEKLEDILELTEQNGMIHLRKAEIRDIVNR